ncbi:MAG: META domain-containing protein [Microbacteriaceae bacterium]
MNKVTVAIIGMSFVAMLSLAGCAPEPVNSPSPDVVGQWQLVSGADGPRALTFDQNTIITLDIAKDVSGGQGPCNRYGVNVEGGNGAASTVRNTDSGERDGSQIRFGMTLQTLMACADTDLTELETRYFAALPQITSAAIDQGSLVLQGGSVQLLFEPVTSLSN